MNNKYPHRFSARTRARRAVLYTQETQSHQFARLRLPLQMDILREIAALHGLTVIDELVDDGEDGLGAPAQRPGGGRVLELAKGGHFEVLLVTDLDRLSMNADGPDLRAFHAALKESGVALWTLAGEV